MVIWTRPALADLKAIHDFIAKDYTHYAKKVAQTLREKADVLNRLPNIGRMVPEVNEAHIRELRIYSYRVMYEVMADHHRVLAWCTQGKILRHRICQTMSNCSG